VQLRQKFSLLVLIYVLSLSANLVMSGWCIIVYFRSAFIEFDSDFGWEQRIDRLRTLERRQRALLEEQRDGRDLLADYNERQEELSSSMAQLQADMAGQPLAASWPEIENAAAKADAVARRRLGELANRGRRSAPPASMPAANLASFVELDRALGRLAGALADERFRHVGQVADVQDRVVKILIINTVCGAVLCALGVVFVTRWVIRPVAALREAAREIGSGNLSHRIQTRSHDELGKLADEVNQMAATIVEMQVRLIEKERLAAAGEMFTRVAHNIRNPLAGMRGLAEATSERHADNPETVECQARIMDTIDRFEKWLRDVQQSVSPMTLNLQPARIDELIANVATVLRPMADRRRVNVQVEVDPSACRVRIDASHIEQALVALLTNAVQASEPGQSVRVSVRQASEGRGSWQLMVEDDGAGIRPEIRDAIFLPYFTTKPDGNGIGLAIANKVVRAHGGRLTVESEPGRGSRFLATLPGLIAELE
jgi:signal transduction histidine kinase